MVEIGPGLGAMTEQLLRHLKQMHVVELDRDLIVRLEKRSIRAADHPLGRRAEIRFRANPRAGRSEAAHRGQFAVQHFQPAAVPSGGLRAAGAGPAFHAAKGSGRTHGGRAGQQGVWPPVRDAAVALSLLFIVPPTAFDPPPKVESAIVRMIPVAERLACDQATLEAVVMKAFSQRRKVIAIAWPGCLREEQIKAAGIDPTLRPETVGLEQYVALANLLKAPA